MIDVKSLSDRQAITQLARQTIYTKAQSRGIIARWRRHVAENKKIGCHLVANLRGERDLYCAGWKNSRESFVRVGFFLLGSMRL